MLGAAVPTHIPGYGLNAHQESPNVLFGRVITWGKQSILVRVGSQYTLEEYSKRVNEACFKKCVRASERVGNLLLGETDELNLSLGISNKEQSP